MDLGDCRDSAEVGGWFVDMVSVEKASGSKSKGETDLSGERGYTGGSNGRPDVFSCRLGEVLIADGGDSDRDWLRDCSGCELGNIASGFAMRKPPRDWDRRRSPSIFDGLTPDAGNMPCSSLYLRRGVKRHMEMIPQELAGRAEQGSSYQHQLTLVLRI